MSEQRTNIEEIETTPVTTLQSLVAEGKFVSATHRVPVDWLSVDWKFTLNGVEQPSTEIAEVYAPGGNGGWAVVYVKDVDGIATGETVLVRGGWTIERKPKQGLSETPVG